MTENGNGTFGSLPSKSKLTRVTIQATQIKKWGSDIFKNLREDLVIQVPKSKIKEYAKTLRKGELATYVKIVGK